MEYIDFEILSMAFSNYRKETSERSDRVNWTKQVLMQSTPYYFDAIEGCNQSNLDLVVDMMERARIDDSGQGPDDSSSVLANIISLEGKDVLQRKINFANKFNVCLSYVLYCNENLHVYLYSITSTSTCILLHTFNSFDSFADYISQRKGWRSSKPFMEREDLPEFDKALRRSSCPWPTNIDCFICDRNNNPIGVLEFQNADTVTVVRHCNNEFFLCKRTKIEYGRVSYIDDVRRWHSQEILREQSGLRLFIIVWEKTSKTFTLKEVKRITFPDLRCINAYQYKEDMHKYQETKDRKYGNKIASTYNSYNLKYNGVEMQKICHRPPLSAKDMSFPFIYYEYKQMSEGGEPSLSQMFIDLIEKL